MSNGNPLRKRDEHNAMTLRLNDEYNDYLEYMKVRTGLDKSQLIRLAIHLAPFNDEFIRVCEYYYENNPRSSKDKWIYYNDWRVNGVGWKRA
ncbi:hypothetical protein QB910_000004 [Dabrowskivirus KKP3916]|uniref:Uncharacterized protein n=1 Tax=Alicyclobacillus phage KKP_3916 TaxID=3040651 RepID=A0AAT9V7J1_9CAUD|nr:hypothetical protein QB910_000004 [Alicyclobacillus phage KKP 3916]